MCARLLLGAIAVIRLQGFLKMTGDDKLPSLEELERSIKKAKERISEKENGQTNSGGAMRVSIDLLSGVIVGSLVGYYLDKWLGTLPLFFIICFFLGVAGSGLNIYRSAQRDNKKNS